MQQAENSNQRKRGFTLIELLVSLSLFSMTMLVITSSLLTMVDANRKGQAISSVINNLHFALESMTRNARTGTSYLCGATYAGLSPNDCPSGDIMFGYTAADGKGVYYSYIAGATGRIDRCTHLAGGNCTSGPWIRMTASEINITRARFFLLGNLPFSSSEYLQPRVIMIIQGEASVGGKLSKFNIQTTVAQRTPDR